MSFETVVKYLPYGEMKYIGYCDENVYFYNLLNMYGYMKIIDDLILFFENGHYILPTVGDYLGRLWDYACDVMIESFEYF